jgi:hypothetical protein
MTIEKICWAWDISDIFPLITTTSSHHTTTTAVASAAAAAAANDDEKKKTAMNYTTTLNTPTVNQMKNSRWPVHHLASMKTARSGSTHIRLTGSRSNEWLMIGALGYQSVECYNMSTNKWMNDSSMNVPRSAASCCIDPHTQLVYVIGGLDYGKPDAQVTMESYDPSIKLWKLLSHRLNKPRIGELICVPSLPLST